MPLRRTERSDGQQRPRWKDGSHDPVESTHANESRCDGMVLEPNPWTEPLVTVPPLLGRNHEHEVSTRDRPAQTGADARIEASAANREVRLALLPYGRKFNGSFREVREPSLLSNRSSGPRRDLPRPSTRGALRCLRASLRNVHREPDPRRGSGAPRRSPLAAAVRATFRPGIREVPGR